MPSLSGIFASPLVLPIWQQLTFFGGGGYVPPTTHKHSRKSSHRPALGGPEAVVLQRPGPSFDVKILWGIERGGDFFLGGVGGFPQPFPSHPFPCRLGAEIGDTKLFPSLFLAGSLSGIFFAEGGLPPLPPSVGKKGPSERHAPRGGGLRGRVPRHERGGHPCGHQADGSRPRPPSLFISKRQSSCLVWYFFPSDSQACCGVFPAAIFLCYFSVASDFPLIFDLSGTLHGRTPCEGGGPLYFFLCVFIWERGVEKHFEIFQKICQ